ncbi:MAG: hypothetical protein P1V20_03015 [Verrucomicrobiales bacterium]|nr:hypothetical protein [Verrucomicrobiales bacterium]
MPDENHSRRTPLIPLAPLVDELRGRGEAACRFSGGHTYYAEEVSLFRDFAEENDLFLGERPVEIERPCDNEGNEHKVWFIEDRNVYLKITWPNFFGKLVVHRPDEAADASPIQYLERWHLHNEIFGDNVEFAGVLESDDGLRLLIEQPAIAGLPADDTQILEFFVSNGWYPFRIDKDVAFFDPDTNIAVSDAHPGNIIVMADGLFASIDLRVQKLTSSEVEAIRPLFQ